MCLEGSFKSVRPSLLRTATHQQQCTSTNNGTPATAAATNAAPAELHPHTQCCTGSISQQCCTSYCSNVPEQTMLLQPKQTMLHRTSSKQYCCCS
jgi:hypothetical protein